MAMPKGTQTAVDWALEQAGTVVDGFLDYHKLIYFGRQYFVDHGIECDPMNGYLLNPYLPHELIRE